VNLTIFLFIISDTALADKPPVNLFVMLELFVEEVLRKNDPKMIFRHEFDFRNKIDFLSFVASKMALDDKYVIPEYDFYKLAKDYFNNLDVPQNARSVVDYFVQTKILLREDEKIRFKYTIFYSFFLAQAMVHHIEVRKHIFSDSNATRHLTEIDIYFGCLRNDKDSLLFFVGTARSRRTRTRRMPSRERLGR
jgi:hypothetical protein